MLTRGRGYMDCDGVAGCSPLDLDMQYEQTDEAAFWFQGQSQSQSQSQTRPGLLGCLACASKACSLELR